MAQAPSEVTRRPCRRNRPGDRGYLTGEGDKVRNDVEGMAGVADPNGFVQVLTR